VGDVFMNEAPPIAKTYANAMLALGFAVVTMCAMGAMFDMADRRNKQLMKGKGR